MLSVFNLLKSELQHCNPFQNANTTNEGTSPILPILPLKLFAMVTSLEGSQNETKGYKALPYAFQS